MGYAWILPKYLPICPFCQFRAIHKGKRKTGFLYSAGWAMTLPGGFQESIGTILRSSCHMAVMLKSCVKKGYGMNSYVMSVSYIVLLLHFVIKITICGMYFRGLQNNWDDQRPRLGILGHFITQTFSHFLILSMKKCLLHLFHYCIISMI